MAANSQKPKSDERKRTESRPRNENMEAPETRPHDSGSGHGSNSGERGCLIIAGIVLIIGLILQAIIYLGIPLGMIGLIYSIFHYISSKNIKNTNLNARKAGYFSIIFGVCSLLLASISLCINYVDEDAPLYSFMHPGKITKSSAQNGAD